MYSVSEACERNKAPILSILTGAFAANRHVLEIGSGTGQHAVYFASHLPHLSWQASDTGDYLSGLRDHLANAGPANLLPVIDLDVRRQPWPIESVDALFTANTLHIMGWSAVKDLFRGLGAVTAAAATVCIYGPFRYGGRYTSASNAAFDRFLRARDPESGIRDFESVNALASEENLELLSDHSMPANNQLLVWRKSPRPTGQR